MPVEGNCDGNLIVKTSDGRYVQLAGTSLRYSDGVWTLFYEGRKYMGLIDARSRSEALEQVGLMVTVLLERSGKDLGGDRAALSLEQVTNLNDMDP